MRRFLLAAVTVVTSLVAAGAAQAVVVNVNSANYGVALVPGTRSTLAKAGVPTATSSVSPLGCDPFLSSDLTLLPSIGLCSNGGPVMHSSETFALTWDPGRSYGALTRGYVEQFLKDVADGSGTFTSPYAITSEYQDAGGRAANLSKYGGACIDYGNPGGYTCQFGNTTGTGIGNDYPTSGCTPSHDNEICLTDAQVQAELYTHLTNTQLLGHLATGYTPELVLLTPPGVEVCLDSAGALCSANATSPAQFCSYHSQLNFDGTEVAYVVQPFTVDTACDEPNLPALPQGASPEAIAVYNGSRLVGPLSQSQIAATVNPGMNGWFAEDGSEIDDNYGCVPDGYPSDKVTVGTSAQNPYYLPPEFNNAGVIETDPSVPACALGVTLAPNFVVPSSVEPGDVVQFDGSITPSTLIVPSGGYFWNFGDGTTRHGGPSVEHSYAKGGTYTVELTVTDRGGNVASFDQTMTVLGANGQPVTPSGNTTVGLHARLLLLPQGLRGLLRSGLHLRVSSNQAADGFVTLSIPRSAARRARIRTGRGTTVMVGRGTISEVKDGTVNLRVTLARSMARKLGSLRHVTLAVRLTLATANGDHVAVDAAGRY